jgi:hypothetical protein
MLIEFDLLIAMAAMMLLLPVPLFQIMGNQGMFLKSSIMFSNVLIANANTQRMVFMLGGAGVQSADLMRLTSSSNGQQLSLMPYVPGAYAEQNISVSRLVVLGGKVYYLTVGK